MGRHSRRPGGPEKSQSSGELAWSRSGYKILTEPTGEWGSKWNELPTKVVQIGEADPPPPWVFEREEFRTRPPGPYGWVNEPPTPSGMPRGGKVSVFYIDWPASGVLAPSGDSPQERYNPFEVADRILLDVQRTRSDDEKAILQFVNRWGLLGIGIPGAADFGADGVTFTGEWLALLRQWIETLHALRRGKERETTWAEFAATLNKHLDGVQPRLSVSERSLQRTFAAKRLLDALCFELWDQATEGKRMRRCPECHALFTPGRANQEYCTRLCANRPTVRKWKLEQRRKKRIARQRKKKKEHHSAGRTSDGSGQDEARIPSAMVRRGRAIQEEDVQRGHA